MLQMMISLKLRNYVDSIVSTYNESHVKSFFASSVIDVLRHNNINYDGLEKDVVVLLQSMVDQGILERRYVIFNPENPAEKKVFNSLKDIPVDDDLSFDFNDVYIESEESPLIETFFVFVQNNDQIPKSGAPTLLNIQGEGATKFPNRHIDKLVIQKIIFKNSILGDQINQTLTGNTIGQASAKTNNTNTSVDSNNSQGADLDQVIALIQEISHLNTGSDQLDEQMRQLKQVAEKPTDKKDKWQALSEKVQVINQLCQTAQISLPLLTKLFHLFGF